MKKVIFKLYFCTMAAEDKGIFPHEVRIWPPLQIIEREYSINDSDRIKISGFIQKIISTDKEIIDILGKWGTDNFTFESMYIARKGYFLGLQKDKTVTEIFSDFSEAQIEFSHFFVPGGASIHHHGYSFRIHSNESRHRYLPHVHVIKDGVSVRYSLDTLERFEQDNPSREHLRDEKKIILPFLTKHKEQLLEYWNNYMVGYIPPVLDINGGQFYKES